MEFRYILLILDKRFKMSINNENPKGYEKTEESFIDPIILMVGHKSIKINPASSNKKGIFMLYILNCF
jgi:hypothetical protein